MVAPVALNNKINYDAEGSTRNSTFLRGKADLRSFSEVFLGIKCNVSAIILRLFQVARLGKCLITILWPEKISFGTFEKQAPVVQRIDSAIHWINHRSAEKNFSGSKKLVFSYVVKEWKIKITVRFRASRRLRFDDTKRIMSPEMSPKSFGSFEKRDPGIKLACAVWRFRKRKLKLSCQMLASSTRLQNRSFHVVERTRTIVKCTKMKNPRAKRAKFLFIIEKYANL